MSTYAHLSSSSRSRASQQADQLNDVVPTNWHPLNDDLNSSTPLTASSSRDSFASAMQDGTLTRPGLRRHVHRASAEELGPSDRVVVPARQRTARGSSVGSASESISYRDKFSSSESNLDDWASTPGASSSTSTTSNAEGKDYALIRGAVMREVLVHEVWGCLPNVGAQIDSDLSLLCQVQATDSLAGVALQYGIKVIGDDLLSSYANRSFHRSLPFGRRISSGPLIAFTFER
jgi:hypothetical protein